MLTKKQTPLARKSAAGDPFALLRQMTSALDRMFEESSFEVPLFRGRAASEAAWFPEIDVFQRDNRLVTKIDLPGMKKEDVKVEVTDGQLVISGERKSDAEEKKEQFYRAERGTAASTVPCRCRKARSSRTSRRPSPTACSR